MKFTVILLFVSACLFSQQDSTVRINLEAVLENYNKAMELNSATADQVDSIVYLSINYSYSNKDSCLELGNRSLILARKLKEKSVYAKALLELGDSYRIYGNLDKADSLLSLGRDLYVELGNKGQSAYAYNKLGALYINRGDNESALTNYLKALNSWEELKDSQNIFKPNLNIAWVFYRLNQLDKAQEYNDKAYEIAHDLNDDRQLGMALNNRGIFLSALTKFYTNLADTVPDLSEQYIDTADMYQSRILETHEQSLLIARKLNDRRAIMRSLINIAELKDNNGEYQKSIDLGKEAESMSVSLGDIGLNVMNKKNLAESFRNIKRYTQSIDYGEKALALAKQNNMEAYITGANKELHLSYKAVGQFDKALKCLEEINDYIRKTNEDNTTKVIADAEAKYQNVKKENEILDQQNEIFSLESKNTRIQKQRNTILGSTFLFLIVGFFLLRLNKMRKERNDKREFAEALIFAQEEERKRIAQDLHDGIGQTLLLIKKQMSSNRDTSLENQKMIGETLEEVRSISRDLHPFQLENFGLVSSINDMIEKVSVATGIFISSDISDVDNLLSDRAQINIYRVIQEALNNIVKHSKANAAKVELIKDNNRLKCLILDNGKGFDHEISFMTSESLGLKTMQERILSLNGEFKIYKNNNKGTVVEFNVPY